VGLRIFSAIVQIINIRWFAAVANSLIILRVNLKQKEYFADCVKIVGSAQLALLGLRHVYEKGDVGVPLLCGFLACLGGFGFTGYRDAAE